jgi:hypothetical protein
MTRTVFYLWLGALALALSAPSPARAQMFYNYGPNRYQYDAAWNFNRAYHHYMSSPYNVASFWTTTPGYAMNYYSPYPGYQVYQSGLSWVAPSMATYGYQTNYGVPATGGYYVNPYAGNYGYTPNYGYSYYAPSYNYGSYAPNYGYYP